MNKTTHCPEKLPAWKSPWFWVVVGLVLLVLGVNIFMVFFAVSSNPGLVSKDYYERGKSFTARTKVEFLQKEKLGWNMNLAVPEKITAGAPTLFRVMVKEKEGSPLIVDSATLFAYRPSDSARDFSLPMLHEGNGVYSVEVSFSLKGGWDLIAEIQKDEARQSIAERVFVEVKKETSF